jgi:glyoxylase-like metal-dependent hydrolase (beta-lactamase superfamily II)
MSSWFTVSQLHPQVYAFAEFSHWEQVVSYLIVDKHRAFLVDTGMGYASIDEEVKKITSLPVTVLLTHTHWDHIGGLHEFESASVFNHSFELAQLKKGFSSKEVPELHDSS